MLTYASGRYTAATRATSETVRDVPALVKVRNVVVIGGLNSNYACLGAFSEQNLSSDTWVSNLS